MLARYCVESYIKSSCIEKSRRIDITGCGVAELRPGNVTGLAPAITVECLEGQTQVDECTTLFPGAYYLFTDFFRAGDKDANDRGFVMYDAPVVAVVACADGSDTGATYRDNSFCSVQVCLSQLFCSSLLRARVPPAAA
jgi:hypothetical protein